MDDHELRIYALEKALYLSASMPALPGMAQRDASATVADAKVFLSFLSENHSSEKL